MSPGFENQKNHKNQRKNENNQYIHEFYLSRLQKQRISKSTRKLSANETHITHELSQDLIKSENRSNNI